MILANGKEIYLRHGSTAGSVSIPKNQPWLKRTSQQFSSRKDSHRKTMPSAAGALDGTGKEVAVGAHFSHVFHFQWTGAFEGAGGVDGTGVGLDGDVAGLQFGE